MSVLEVLATGDSVKGTDKSHTGITSKGSRAYQAQGNSNGQSGTEGLVNTYMCLRLLFNDVISRFTTRPKVLGVYWDQLFMLIKGYNSQSTTNTVVVEFGPTRPTAKVI